MVELDEGQSRKMVCWALIIVVVLGPWVLLVVVLELLSVSPLMLLLVLWLLDRTMVREVLSAIAMMMNATRASISQKVLNRSPHVVRPARFSMSLPGCCGGECCS